MFFVYFHIIKLYSLVDLISNFSYIYCSVDSAWDKWSFKYNQIEGVRSSRPFDKEKKFFSALRT